MTLTAIAPASVTVFKAWASVFCLSCAQKGRNKIIGKVREDHLADTSEFFCRDCRVYRVV